MDLRETFQDFEVLEFDDSPGEFGKFDPRGLLAFKPWPGFSIGFFHSQDAEKFRQIEPLLTEDLKCIIAAKKHFYKILAKFEKFLEEISIFTWTPQKQSGECDEG